MRGLGFLRVLCCNVVAWEGTAARSILCWEACCRSLVSLCLLIVGAGLLLGLSLGQWVL